MFEITCDKCGTNLFLDYNTTANEYKKDAHYNIDKDSGKIIEASIQQYLVYTCPLCNTSCKFTYADWERRYRKSMAEYIMEFRKQEMFKNLDPRTLDPDNGVAFCGQCSGYNNDGYCLKDIIKQCTIRDPNV